MTLPDLIAKLIAIDAQKPTASVRCEQANGYAYLLETVDYDANTNAVVLGITDEP